MASAGTTPFYGREHELQRLQELAGKKTASLVIIKGRRRIGKSRLATELARRLPGYGALSFQGLPPTAHVTAGQEREDFAQQINRQLGIPAPRADDWNTLLWSLADRTRSGRHLIVLDEINWLGSKDPTFLGKLKNAWDAEFSQNPHLILILSGSLSGWIERNILHHTGFLGRVSLDFTLPELPFQQTPCGRHRRKYRRARVFCVRDRFRRTDDFCGYLNIGQIWSRLTLLGQPYALPATRKPSLAQSHGSAMWLLSREIRAGEVQVLLPDLQPEPLPINLVYPAGRRVPMRVRVFMDYLVSAFKRRSA